ncbi:hypothetical protein L9F63_010938 [Diploptera punctata]|uniref:Farnesol dehydrogenase n=1 Tax=Diploptera punctata TaxID=6984 RepID=A0AAD8AG40_DIPPU|nr:hypothetical protein L9F63_010938 [Diploptera punctata]
MERWRGKVAIVTGTSSGIGAAIATDLVKHGLQVVGLARRVDRTKELASELKNEAGILLPLKCDISKEEEILSAFVYVNEELGGADILVNNAGVLNESLLGEGLTEEWSSMLNTNILGLSICTREAIKSMKQRNIDQGHIVHINSIAGHYDLDKPGYHMYSATKHAVTALTEGLRKELVSQGSKIRVTSISPGLVNTEMIRVGMKIEDVEELLKNKPCLKPSDVSDVVMYVLGSPSHVQIVEVTMKSVGEINL